MYANTHADGIKASSMLSGGEVGLGHDCCRALERYATGKADVDDDYRWKARKAQQSDKIS